MLEATTKRFRWILDGQARGPLPECDLDLVNDPHFAVTPSLGSLTPGWLLIVPRRPVRCISQLCDIERSKLLTLAKQLQSSLCNIAPNVYMFEHGAGGSTSSLNCGVDQAHLHIVPLPFDLVEVAAKNKFDWVEVSLGDPWENTSPMSDYYFVSDFKQALLAQSIAPESQFFRKLIAYSLDVPWAWDYKSNPFPEVARQTVEALHFYHAA